MHGGVPLAPFYDELRTALGATVKFHEVYPASEGFIAAQDRRVRSSGLRLMTNAGIFFEFLPMADFDETRLDQLGPKIVPIAGVKPGVDYALLLTTPAGLVRYVIGDVVRFISTRAAAADLRGAHQAAVERLRRTRDREGGDRRAARGVLGATTGRS